MKKVVMQLYKSRRKRLEGNEYNQGNVVKSAGLI